MKKHPYSFRHITLPIILVLMVVACSPREKWVKNQGSVFGTYYHLIYKSPQGKDLNKAVLAALDSVNSALSTYDTLSVISRFNRSKNGIIENNIHFNTVLSAGRTITKATDGAFDMTVAPLVNAWGFGFSKKQSITPTLIDSLLSLVGMQQVQIRGDSLIKKIPGLMIDASAIAKGYGVDMAAKVLEQHGCTNYLVEIGGEIFSKGRNQKNEPWRIGIDKPIDDPSASKREIQVVIKLSGKAMATSGNYRQFYIDEKTGRKYAHTIDPRSGMPVQHSLLSASVITDNCMTADAYATACMVLGLEKSLDLFCHHPDLEGYFIYDTPEGMKTATTPGFKKYMDGE
ncbi:FAD:protein FMN transferase [Thermophagus sp. OGC60D27]|uniref:FAD:protein FMN transferase n=1 Tax=Thermophagus sp. OGC60D27 TaxID=3458415 RepID=UPI004037D596